MMDSAFDDTAQTLQVLIGQLDREGEGGAETLLQSLPAQAKGILVVDDTVEALRILVTMLSEEGHEVRSANGGVQALEAVRALRPELVLLDVRMPGMDGFEVCRQLKSNETTHSVPVLFLSATGDDEERLRCFDVGGVDFISKPFQREELLARVRTHLELSRLRSRLEEQVQDRTASLKTAILRIAEECTGKEQLQGVLEKSERRYRNLVEKAPVGMYQLTLQGTFKYVNNAMLRQFGCVGHEEFMREHSDFKKCWEDQREFGNFLQVVTQQGSLEGHTAWLFLRGKVQIFLHYAFFDVQTGLINGISVAAASRRI